MNRNPQNISLIRAIKGDGTKSFSSADQMRARFSTLMSEMYRREVPQYGKLLDLVADINDRTLRSNSILRAQMERTGELQRLHVEQHGAIRLGTAAELAWIRRMFAVMGMFPVGYYDLSVAGVPVHSTAFRPIEDRALKANPFRVFTSLLRLDLISDPELQSQARTLLERRRIFSERLLELIVSFEQHGGLTRNEADEFVHQASKTFRWQEEASVSASTYQKLHDAHRLLADVACFKGPHINHLTPRTLDIDAAQKAMPACGIEPKDVIEGPPQRKVPILLRQTSFKALSERVDFVNSADKTRGTHTARFGEIEQRGIALTPKGRALYDALLERVRQIDDAGNTSDDYELRLQQSFAELPDDIDEIRRQGLAYFRYSLIESAGPPASVGGCGDDIEYWISRGLVMADPIIYEDFLPVSAAGIFQSNLGGTEQKRYAATEARSAFERDLGATLLDPFELYASAERRSVEYVMKRLATGVPA